MKIEPGLPKYREHVEGGAACIRREACKLDLEQIVSKRKDSRYSSGQSGYWIKTQCKHRDTFVVSDQGGRSTGSIFGRN